MAGLLPAAVYGLTVPNGDVMMPAISDIPAAFRITMAAIDPSAEPEYSGTAIDGSAPRATLKIIRHPIDPDEEEDESDEEEANLKALLNGSGSDEDMADTSDDEEVNGGPSDPSKTKKARREAALKQLKGAFEGGDEEPDGEPDGTTMSEANGELKKLDKGKAVATGDESESSDDDSEDLETEEFVLCTLDTSQHFQQPLDITVAKDEPVFFKVSGTHAVYLTGNYVVPVDDGPRDEDDEDYEDEGDEMGYPPYGIGDESDLSDELDNIDNPRFAEIDTDDEEEKVPQLIKAKGKNKRPAPESDGEAPGLDDIMAKSLKEPVPSTNGEPKLSKKQLKKLKNNEGKAAAAAASSNDTQNGKKDSESPSVKKVQFAKDLEQGPSTVKSEPTESIAADKKADKKDETKDEKKGKASAKATLGVKEVQGVSVDDKKLGSGPTAKKGSRVSMRYIGKLNDGKVFDSNKKGKPFSFKLGLGEVIKGWEIGIEGISVGGERRIRIPARLAYGSKSMPGIPVNSELTFDIKCLEVK